jgi:hypothetical protein
MKINLFLSLECAFENVEAAVIKISEMEAVEGQLQL